MLSIYIYTQRFSTYAIGYTPYYSMNFSLTFGDYQGTATVRITDEKDGTVYVKENVSVGNISFAEIPTGRYLVTLTWIIFRFWKIN